MTWGWCMRRNQSKRRSIQWQNTLVWDDWTVEEALVRIGPRLHWSYRAVGQVNVHRWCRRDMSLSSSSTAPKQFQRLHHTAALSPPSLLPTIDNMVAPVMAPTDSGDINELFQLTLFCEKWEMKKWFLPRMGLIFYVETYQVFYVVPTRPFFKLWAFLLLFQVETCRWRSLVFWLALAYLCNNSRG